MVLRMRGSVSIEADRETIWSALHDVAYLKPCVPGCTRLDRVSATRFDVAALVPFGPVRVPFSGRVETGECDPLHVLRLNAHGDGLAGLAQGSAAIVLVETPTGCRLSYEAVLAPAGPFALLGTLFLSGLMRTLSDRFANDFAMLVGQQRQDRQCSRASQPFAGTAQ